MSIHARSLPDQIQKHAMTLSFFEHLDSNESEVIFSHLNYQKLEAEELIFKEGSTGNQCYFILQGEVKVCQTLSTGSQQRLATLHQGDLFGQIALIDRKPRSASCYAATSCGLLSLSSEHFDMLYSAQSPFAYKILDHIVTDLSKRLRGATEQLYKANQSKNQKQRTTHSLRALQALSGLHDTDDLDQIEWVVSDFEQKLKYSQ